MLGTDVQQSFGDAYREATAAMRLRFEERVLAAASWSEGIVKALDDLADGILADPERAQAMVTDARHSTLEVLRLCDEERQTTITSLARGWCHHHDGPVPELQLEFLCGAIGHVIAGALARDELDDLHECLFELVAFVGDHAA
jgi:hypothetical protein